MPSTTLSSVGQSGAMMLDPKAKSTTVQLSLNQISSLDVTIQVTLDDPTSLGSTVVTWCGLSTTHYSSQTLDLNGIFLTILSPVGGLRISSSTIIAGTTITLKSLQSVTA